MRTLSILIATATLTLVAYGCVEEKRTEKVYIGGLESSEEGSEPIYEKETVNE